jgi:allantoate deiminase
MIEKQARARKALTGKARAVKAQTASAGKALRFGPTLMGRLDALAGFTEVPSQLTRRYLTPAHVAAMQQVKAWMEEAGMQVRVDAVCNVIGRYEATGPGAPAIVLGSHIDTVVDAGKYDGNLGVLAAVAAVGDMASRGERLDHAIEVVAFGEEEGVRFPSHLLTSSALVGALEPGIFDARDAQGVSVREALSAAGGNADAYRSCACKKDGIAAYLELHIEQGPVLYDKGRAAAAVTAIDGSIRLIVGIRGFAGHAGTVPMGFRRDALAAAAEMIVAIERLGASQRDLVATVGRLDARPGAPNVIPGQVEFTVDMRSPSDAVRHSAQRELLALLRDIAVRRRIELETRIYQEIPATALDARITAVVRAAIAACGLDVQELSSGAGHDAMMMARFCPSGMIFLRCKDGISHNPAESITVEDADVSVRVLLETVRRVDRLLRGRS